MRGTLQPSFVFTPALDSGLVVMDDTYPDFITGGQTPDTVMTKPVLHVAHFLTFSVASEVPSLRSITSWTCSQCGGHVESRLACAHGDGRGVTEQSGVQTLLAYYPETSGGDCAGPSTFPGALSFGTQDFFQRFLLSIN